MFTGLVEKLATVAKIESTGPGCDLFIAESDIAGQVSIGESIAVNGACLTVIHHDSRTMQFQVSPETLDKTNLGELRIGDRVNLERSLRVGDRLGGHMVQGHVDGVGSIERREPQEEWDVVWFHCPPELALQMVPKGSVAVDGVSLTVVESKANGFSVALIPHTLEITTLGFKKNGDSVNLETDVLAKYVAKYLANLNVA